MEYVDDNNNRGKVGMQPIQVSLHAPQIPHEVAANIISTKNPVTEL